MELNISQEEFIKMHNTMPFREITETLGISEWFIRKYARQLGLVKKAGRPHSKFTFNENKTKIYENIEKYLIPYICDAVSHLDEDTLNKLEVTQDDISIKGNNIIVKTERGNLVLKLNLTSVEIQ